MSSFLRMIPCLLFYLWRHLLMSFCSKLLILPLNRLFWATELDFYEILIIGKVFLTWPEEQPGKIFLWYHVSFLTYNFIVDIILLYFTALFWTTKLDFTKYSWGIKLYNITRGIIWQNFFLMPCLVFDLWLDLWR